MTTKEYLEQLRQRDAIIRQKQELLDELEQKKFDVSAAQYTNAKSKTNDITDRTADTIARIDQIKRQIQKELDSYLNLFEQITKQINVLPDAAQRELLTLRYVKGLKWEEIETTIGYEQRHCHRIHCKALQEFDRIATSDAWGQFME